VLKGRRSDRPAQTTSTATPRTWSTTTRCRNWRLTILNFVDTWAHAAVAIVVVVWLVDVALAQQRERPA
jgi:hypothetical protein